MLASMAKLKAGRMMRLVTDGCLQYWGGAGYLWESPTARAFRDSRLASIGGGADEVMLQIISKLHGHAAAAGRTADGGRHELSSPPSTKPCCCAASARGCM